MTPLVVLIGGGSGAGKTTLAHWLRDRLAPVTARVIGEDDYFRRRPAHDRRAPEDINFDDIAEKDHDLLRGHLERLKSGARVRKPIYDFVAHRRSVRTESVAPSPVIIVEGTHVLYRDDIVALADLTVYIDTPDDIRLARRILRDVSERGRRTTDVIAQYLLTVKPMHYRYVYPGRFRADVVIEDFDSRAPGASGFDDGETDHPGARALHRMRNLLAKR